MKNKIIYLPSKKIIAKKNDIVKCRQKINRKKGKEIFVKPCLGLFAARRSVVLLAWTGWVRFAHAAPLRKSA